MTEPPVDTLVSPAFIVTAPPTAEFPLPTAIVMAPPLPPTAVPVPTEMEPELPDVLTPELKLTAPLAPLAPAFADFNTNWPLVDKVLSPVIMVTKPPVCA